MSRELNPSSSNRTDEWLTPPEIITELGPFDLDPCSPKNRPWPTAKKHYTFIDNGLMLPWKDRIWLNPPYSSLDPWLNRMAIHMNGTVLIFNRSDTNTFHNLVFPITDSILYIKQRLKFYDVTGKISKSNAGAPSVLISYSDFDSQMLSQSNIKGFHHSLTPQMYYISFDEDKRTWKVILGDVMNEFDKEATLSQIYDKVLLMAPKRARRNKNYKAKVRQTLQYYFNRIKPGIYSN